MREIKFRAWHKEKKYMKYDDIYPDGKRDWSEWEQSFGCMIHVMQMDFELMQFTGLKDKNGRDIFEGDVIASGASYNLEVFWMGIAWGVRWKDMGNDEQCIINDDGGDMEMDDNGLKHMEVIGNIYENGDLIK